MLESRKISFQIYSSKEEYGGWADGLEICYVLRGKGSLAFLQNRQWRICENDIFAVNMYEMYQISLDPDGLILRLQIPEEFVLSIYPEAECLKMDCFSFLYGNEEQERFDRLREKTADVFKIYSKNDFQAEMRMRGTVSGLLAELISSFGKEKGNALGRRGREQFGMLMEYVRQHYQEEISLTSFSRESHYSASHLSHLMKSELGISFTEYLKRIRIQHALQPLRQGKSITQTAEITGFANSNAFIKAFRDIYGVTPGKYRAKQQMAENPADSEAGVILDEPHAASHLFDRLFSYAGADREEPEEKPELPEMELRKCRVNVRKSGNEISENWRFSVNGGYAKRILYEQVQKAIRKIQDEIGFQYIRVKDIFNDELQICTRNLEGTLIFNYVQFDSILDFISSCHAKPWIELSYMPTALSTAKPRAGRDAWLIAMPDAPEEWLTLVRHLLCHVKERYGENEVSRWIITPFADFFLVDMHMQNKDGYFELYRKTHALIRELLPRTRIAARGPFEKDGSGLGDYMVREKVLPDFWTMVNYNSISPSEEKTELNLIESMEAYSLVISRDTEHLKHQIMSQKAEMKEHGIEKIPLILAEWNSTIWQRDLCSDTAYKACYLVKNVLENCNDISGFSYWHVSDWNDDYVPSPSRFHGGFGLFTRDGIPKAVYGAFRLLKEAEGRILARGEGYMVLNSGEKILVYLYNYCPYDMLYRYRHTRELSLKNRYGVFEAEIDICYQIKLEDLEPGTYQKRVFQISRKAGSACDVWMQMGAPEKLSALEYSYLLAAGSPQCTAEQIETGAEYVLQSVLKPHAVQLIELCREADIS